MDLAIQDGQKTRESPLSRGGAFMLCLKRRELSAQRKPNCPRWEVQKGGHEGHAREAIRA